MQFFEDLGANYPFVSALVAMLIAQVFKTIYYYLKERKMNFKHLTEAGGLPSSHSAMVSALAAGVGLELGWTSPIFAIALIFAIIVMYDAAGVRRAAGRQARVLNAIADDIYTTGKVAGGRLQELIGHTPVEVFAGAILGVIVALVMY